MDRQPLVDPRKWRSRAIYFIKMKRLVVKLRDNDDRSAITRSGTWLKNFRRIIDGPIGRRQSAYNTYSRIVVAVFMSQEDPGFLYSAARCTPLPATYNYVARIITRFPFMWPSSRVRLNRRYARHRRDICLVIKSRAISLPLNRGNSDSDTYRHSLKMAKGPPRCPDCRLSAFPRTHHDDTDFRVVE